MKQTIKVIVKGQRRGKTFNTKITFTLIPPTGMSYAGNGHFMSVDMPGSSHYVDVRYSHTTDIKKLATIWIKDYFGKNATNAVIVGGVKYAEQ